MHTFPPILKMKIQDLVGHQVSSICFVMDYLEIGFDGPIVRCLGEVIVSGSDERKLFPQTGSRDLLCGLIGKEISMVNIVDGSYCKLNTKDGWQVCINLQESAENPETMHFVPGENEPIQVW